ncbi:type I pullulanase [Bacillaceae bacterium IKA-2]|nr:type I pullulanase [Bacillaceae bacterium IKA-2]
MTKNAYIDELTLITIPFSEVDEELSDFTMINLVTGEQLIIKEWFKKNGRGRYELYLANPIPLRCEYRVIANNQLIYHVKIGQVVRTRFFDDLYYYQENDLGVTYTDSATTFKLWAPTATDVQIIFFNGDKEQYTRLAKADKGVWEISINGDLEGSIFMYNVYVDGVWRKAVDPYARAVTVNGQKGVVTDLSKTNPHLWKDRVKPSFRQSTDAIIYELHIRDFSIDEHSGMKHKGKFKALLESDTKGPWETITGLDYLVDLGITHVQLLPIQDFGSVDETTLLDHYNWGYDTTHFNAIEGSYSLNPIDPTLRIKELKEVIQSFHNHGIRVIFDVVYNHVYVHSKSDFEKIVPGYYFRYHFDGSLADGTGVGNDIASERRMVQKFIVDSAVYFAEEYNIDGFRFDLMGILDLETMQQIRERLNELDPSILVIGEGWDLDTPLAKEKKSTISNSEQLPGISFFNDQFRNKLKGNIFQMLEQGFCNGNGDLKDDLKMLVSGSTKGFYPIEGMFKNPNQSVNYVECHDNHTLWDRLILANGNESEQERAAMHRLATSMTILSQGIPFIHAGQEFFRTKNGVENSYNSPDEINKFDWKRKALHLNYVEYLKGLISLRKKHCVFRLMSSDEIKKKMHILDTPSSILAYLLKSEFGMFVVIHNGGKDNKEVILPANGFWDVLVEGEEAGITSLRTIEGAKTAIHALSTTVVFHQTHPY